MRGVPSASSLQTHSFQERARLKAYCKVYRERILCVRNSVPFGDQLEESLMSGTHLVFWPTWTLLRRQAEGYMFLRKKEKLSSLNEELTQQLFMKMIESPKKNGLLQNLIFLGRKINQSREG